MITLIAATDQEQGIGLNNKMPWHLPEDLKYFKQQTVGHNVIMGHNTFKSIGFALPNRMNVVVTRSRRGLEDSRNITYVESMDEAWLIAGTKDVFVIGGAQIYSLALPKAERVLITEINQSFGCDTFFPRLCKNRWYEQSSTPIFKSEHESGLEYRFVTYLRR